jgi:flagellin
MRINHNISALRALNQLEKSNSKLDKSLERLSSGLRINHASDDAAGLAITQKMDTQVRGLEQANRNAMDGVSLIQTAEGALGEVQSMLQRIRELAVQASNGTYEDDDRVAIQAEISELQTEIQRVSEDTEFNGMTLLNGDIDRRSFSSDEAIASIVSMSDSVDPGEYTFNVSQAATKTTNTGATVSLFDASGNATLGGTVNIDGEQITINIGDSSESVFSQLRDLTSKVDITLSSSTTPFGNTSQLGLELNEYGSDSISISGSTALLSALGIDTSAGQVTENLGNDVQVDTVTTANGFPVGTTVTTDGDDILFEASNGFELRLVGGASTGTVTTKILETGPLNLQIGANEGQYMEVRIPNMSASALGITDINLSTAEGAEETITTIDDAITMVSNVRSKLGAYQNRLEYTVSNLDSATENMTASMSRIVDADMAYEMSEYTQQNIIQQAGTSMLAQANQRPQSLLQLLQG